MVQFATKNLGHQMAMKIRVNFLSTLTSVIVIVAHMIVVDENKNYFFM